MPNICNQPQFLTEVEAAHVISVEPRTLKNWRSQGRGPTYYKLPAIRYRHDDLLSYIESKRVDVGGRGND